MIDVVDVRKSYRSGDRRVEALRGISCRIAKGRFAFIVGPSGSGKSTLLYLLGALDRPTSGTIRVEGQDLTAMSEAETERLPPRPGRLHLPVVQPDQQPDGRRERARAVPAARGDARAAAAGRRAAERRSAWATGSTTARTRCRAASSSGWRSPGR